MAPIPPSNKWTQKMDVTKKKTEGPASGFKWTQNGRDQILKHFKR